LWSAARSQDEEGGEKERKKPKQEALAMHGEEKEGAFRTAPVYQRIRRRSSTYSKKGPKRRPSTGEKGEKKRKGEGEKR